MRIDFSCKTSSASPEKPCRGLQEETTNALQKLLTVWISNDTKINPLNFKASFENSESSAYIEGGSHAPDHHPSKSILITVQPLSTVSFQIFSKPPFPKMQCRDRDILTISKIEKNSIGIEESTQTLRYPTQRVTHHFPRRFAHQTTVNTMIAGQAMTLANSYYIFPAPESPHHHFNFIAIAPQVRIFGPSQQTGHLPEKDQTPKPSHDAPYPKRRQTSPLSQNPPAETPNISEEHNSDTIDAAKALLDLAKGTPS